MNLLNKSFFFFEFEQFFVVSLAEVLVLGSLLDSLVEVIGQINWGQKENDHGNHSVSELICFDFSDFIFIHRFAFFRIGNIYFTSF